MASPRQLSELPTPPGPRGLPIRGSVHKLRGAEPLHIALSRLADGYGDLCIVRLGSVPTALISHPDLMRQAFEKRQISERWANEVFTCLSGSEGLIYSSFDGHWQEVSDLAHGELWSFDDVANISEIHFTPAIDDVIERIGRMADAGDPVRPLETLFSGNFLLTFRTLFGWEEESPEFLRLAADLEERIVWFNVAAATLNPADVFLWTRFLPSKMIRESRRQRDARDGVIGALVERVSNRQIQDKPDPPCFVKVMLAKEALGEISRPTILALCMDVLGAVPSGVSATVSWFLLLVANRPKVQTRIQEEIADAFNDGAEPGIDPRTRLPYTFACIAESMRYRTIAPLAIPHRTTQDTEVGGYRIPANTQVLGNIYSVHHDHRFWDSPDEFAPERFLPQSDGSPSPALTSAAYMPFGVGIRRCTGDHFALNAFWLYVVNLVSRFHFAPSGGQPLTEDEVFALSVSPKPFALKATRH